MADRVFFFGVAIVGALALSPSLAFSQAQATPTRIPQQIVINGQMASGAYVTGTGGQLQNYTCPSPQKYSAADGSSQGWACYEQTTGVWLLSALPPASAPQAVPVAPPAQVAVPQNGGPPPFVVFPRSAPVYQQPPTVVYQQPPTVVYQQPPTILYQPPPTVIYAQPAPPTVIYAPAPPPVIVEPEYPSSVVLGRAAIDAAGRIASAVILNSRYPRDYVTYNTYEIGPDRGRHDRGRRW